ncbi:MAG: alpha-L-arabinofuranosidase C-terminal domain-containing protein [Bacteroidales bacterium]
MKKYFPTIRFLTVIIFLLQPLARVSANHQDTVYLFAYSVNQGRDGLAFAWSLDHKDWHPIGPHHVFLYSDFGSWGSQKKLEDPFLMQDQQGRWHCLWTLNTEVGQLAHAASENLYDWKRQSYPVVMPGGNVLVLEAVPESGGYRVSWFSEMNGDKKIYSAFTEDFKNYSSALRGSQDVRRQLREQIDLNGTLRTGTVNRVPWELVAELIEHEEWARYQEMERAESMADDPIRFAHLGNLEAVITPKKEDSKSISDMLIGIFFEDINYAADGGLYAELIQNRDFEYDPGDRDYRDPAWTSRKAWSAGDGSSLNIDTIDPIHPNNSHYAAWEITGEKGILMNLGWDGIAIEAPGKYDLSFFGRVHSPGTVSMRILLRNSDGEVAGETSADLSGSGWKKYSSVIDAGESVPDARLEIECSTKGKIDLDMISLFPQRTFMNRKNGLRRDLAQVIADMHPKFVRFPGGCVAHGDGLANMYRWENTIGPLEGRVPRRNIWNYHQSAGLGYFEYFQFCEDIGAEPVPVVPAGVPCQNSHTGGHGQQCGIPMGEMDAYVQSVLDLVEWANGDPDTPLGRKRADAGHPEPFNLKYLGVGNEDLITDVFEERFTMIAEAIRVKHPEITVIGTVGPFSSGTDYEEGWDLARKLKLPMVDEHYYQTPGWFINNQDFYDRYDRGGTKVYLGEYAAHVRGRRNNMETALSEALFLTSLERNGDVVQMSSYAPLLAKEGYTNWNPDLIYFSNTEIIPTVGYEVQKLFGHHSGDQYIPVALDLSQQEESVHRRIGVSLVSQKETGDLILKLVNLLPVEVDAFINLNSFDIQEKGELIVLKGEPGDESVKPIKSEIRASGILPYHIPKYSFSVIRFRTR